jgi:hypothetical protein
MFIGFHVNTSTCSLRKLTSMSSYLRSRSAPIRAVLDRSPGMRTTSFTSLDLVNAQVASIVGISSSSSGTYCKAMMQSYKRMEISVASTSAKLSFS